jgi:signal transduction histidine kinase
MRQFKKAAVPILLVLTAYLLTFSPPFSRSYNSLFVLCVTISAWNYGCKSGILAWLLSILLLVWKLDTWPARGPMSYTSFTSACWVIIWLVYQHNTMKYALKAELNSRRAQEMARAKQALSQLSHDLTDALSAMLAESQLALWRKPDALERVENAALRAADLIKRLKAIRDLL